MQPRLCPLRLAAVWLIVTHLAPLVLCTPSVVLVLRGTRPSPYKTWWFGRLTVPDRTVTRVISDEAGGCMNLADPVNEIRVYRMARIDLVIRMFEGLDCTGKTVARITSQGPSGRNTLPVPVSWSYQVANHDRAIDGVNPAIAPIDVLLVGGFGFQIEVYADGPEPCATIPSGRSILEAVVKRFVPSDLTLVLYARSNCQGVMVDTIDHAYVSKNLDYSRGFGLVRSYQVLPRF